MKYRVLLIDPHKSTAKPVQAFFNHAAEAWEWVKTMLSTASGEAFVQLYQTIEVPVFQFKKPDVETVETFLQHAGAISIPKPKNPNPNPAGGGAQ